MASTQRSGGLCVTDPPDGCRGHLRPRHCQT